MAELSALEMVGRLVLAAALGAAVGAERELRGQDAGLRTHLMLALGAALFGLVSVGAWDDFFARRNDTNYQVDVTRVASYVAAGIGFIGGGAILKQAGGVRGLTTASSLWVVAAIGLSCGVGFWIPAVVAAVLSVVSLVALVPVRSLMRRASPRRGGHIVVVLRDERGLAALVEVLQNHLAVTPGHIEAGPATDGNYEVVVTYSGGDPLVLAQCASEIAALDTVSAVHLDSS